MIETALGHVEIQVERIEEDAVRPRFFCRKVTEATHSAFRGFNRAQAAVIEAAPEFAGIHEKLIEIVNSRDRIPTPTIRGPWIYNFWRDADHVRGIWRRTSLTEFSKDEPAWETVLDVDAQAATDGENWVWKGAQGLYPDYRLFLVTLSRGGGDASSS